MVYIALIVEIDNTNLATTNGLWKTPAVRSWELGTGRPIDIGGLFYMPAYGWLCRLIPNEAVSYGDHGEVVTFRKMAILNALFGALASGVVFLLALRFVPSAGLAFVVSVAHLSSGFVLLNSINSEDVIPAYAFFTIATALFFEYVFTRKLYLLAGCALFLALTVLFHWTLMIPCAAALGAAQLNLVLKRKHPAWLLAVFPLLFLTLIEVVALYGHFQNPSFWGWSPLPILYPAKAGPSGWLGFQWNKVVYASVGIGNYFSGVQNVVRYREYFNSPEMRMTLSVSWIYLAVTFGACVWASFSRRTAIEVKIFARYGLVLFLIGELEHLYSQPQDPQSQIQPMFIGVFGLIILMREARTKLAGLRLRLAISALLLVFALNGAWNLKLMWPNRGQDSESIRAVRKLEELFPPGNTIIVSHGFEGWNTWWFVEVFDGSRADYLSKTIHLASAFISHPGISAQEAASLTKRQIDEALAAGYREIGRAHV